LSIHKTLRYIDVLQDLVTNYNKTRHHTIQEYPNYVHLCDLGQKECQQANNRVEYILKNIDAKINAPMLNHIMPLEKGDKVRVVAYLDPNLSRKQQFMLYKISHKIKQPNWTKERYLIDQVFKDGYIIKYRVKSKENDIIDRKYYHHELQKVSGSTVY